jgi:hypothetical protein
MVNQSYCKILSETIMKYTANGEFEKAISIIKDHLSLFPTIKAIEPDLKAAIIALDRRRRDECISCLVMAATWIYPKGAIG